MNVQKIKLPGVVLLLALLAVARPGRAQAQDDSKGVATAIDEAAEAEAELRSAAENNKMRYENYTGKLSLWTKEDPQLPNVIGTFETKDNKYYLRLGNDSVRKGLEKFDGKDVTLIGWSSNHLKYFVATGAVTSTGAAPTTSHHKRGGL